MPRTPRPLHRDGASAFPRALALPLCLLPMLAACPASVSGGKGEAAPAEVDASDPRVVRSERSGDLYPHDVKALPEEKPDLDAMDGVSTEADPLGIPGVGRPDETNGVCRLYAPEFPDPECCAPEFGVDVARIKALCGYQIYLGEHFRNGCGYHFKATPEGKTLWLWAGHLQDATSTTEAMQSHERQIQKRFREPEFRATPVRGVPGAYSSVFSGVGWAVVPGWKQVRQFGFPEGFCGDKLPELLAELAAAKPPPPGAERVALLPTARK